jgi:glycosyltransferase involved in cell wall biosynthesis
LKVLWIAERFPPDRGGAAASAGRQTARLAPRVERLDVLRLSPDVPAGLMDLEERDGLRVHRVGRAASEDESLQLLARAAENLRSAHGYDLIHGFYAVHAGYVASIVAKTAGIPCVVSLRGNDLDRAMYHGPRLPFLLWTLQNATALLGVSREILDKARTLSGREAGMRVVVNGVDGALFAPGTSARTLENAPRPWIGFAGELRLKKGLPILREIAARATGTLVWIGGVRAEERPALADWKRREPAAAARVREVEYASDPATLADWYRAMDLMVFPSLWDGLPNALLEAMACGRPVLACAVGGIPEVVRDRLDGLLIQPRDLHRFAAEAVRVSMEDPALLRRLGETARARMLHAFTPEAERDAILDVWRSLVS